MKHIRHKRTGTIYWITGAVKARVNSDSWTDAVLYMNFRTGEQFVTDQARIDESFEVLQNCPECDGGGMVHGCFCENPKCNDGLLVE